MAASWAGPSARHSEQHPAYDAARERQAEARKTRVGVAGDPAASASAILAVVDAEEPPLRIFLGAGPIGIAKADYASRIETWEKWQPVSEAAQG